MVRTARWCCVVCGLVMLCVSSALFAQESTATTVAMTAAAVTPEEQAQRDALRALIPLYEEAANEGNLDALKPILDTAFSGVMVTGDEVTSFATLQEYWANIRKMMGEGGSYRVRVNVTDHAFIAGDLAVAHGTTDEVVNAKGNEYRFLGRWTAVCRKQDGQWKLLRIHASMPAIDNPFVTATVRAASISTGLALGVAGLVVGWILHVIVARRRKATVTV